MSVHAAVLEIDTRRSILAHNNLELVVPWEKGGEIDSSVEEVGEMGGGQSYAGSKWGWRRNYAPTV